jgi:hypothetical protein
MALILISACTQLKEYLPGNALGVCQYSQNEMAKGFPCALLPQGVPVPGSTCIHLPGRHTLIPRTLLTKWGSASRRFQHSSGPIILRVWICTPPLSLVAMQRSSATLTRPQSFLSPPHFLKPGPFVLQLQNFLSSLSTQPRSLILASVHLWKCKNRLESTSINSWHSTRARYNQQETLDRTRKSQRWSHRKFRPGATYLKTTICGCGKPTHCRGSFSGPLGLAFCSIRPAVMSSLILDNHLLFSRHSQISAPASTSQPSWKTSLAHPYSLPSLLAL